MQRSAIGNRRLGAGSVRAASAPERRLASQEEDDLKLDYEAKRDLCYESKTCYKKQAEQVKKVYERLTDATLPDAPAYLNTTLCADAPLPLGLFLVADFTRNDRVATCKNALAAECELELFKAEKDGKVLYIELKEVLDAVACGAADSLPCLDDYDFQKKETNFMVPEDKDYVRVFNNTYGSYDAMYNNGIICADLPGMYSFESGYIDTPDVGYDVGEVEEYCFP